MHRRLSPIALLLGIAGLAPFLGCALLAVGDGGDRAGFALVAYGAVILAFLGGVHWGFALIDPTGVRERLRLALGVMPSLLGWVALLLAMAVNLAAGLGMLVAGFAAVVVVESRAATAGLMPRSYMTMRYALTAMVGTVLVLVLLMRLFGIHLRAWQP